MTRLQQADAYSIFAEYYDLEFAAFDGDIDFYRQFALEARGPVLELGCGSGRVLSQLTDLGLPLTGVDNSPAMLRLARARLGPSVPLIDGSVEHLDQLPLPHTPYWVAFSAINTFLHLLSTTDQVQALTAVRSVVVAGGLLILDLMTPDPHYLATLDGRLQCELSMQLDDGSTLDKWVQRTHDHTRQMIHTQVWYDVTAPQSQIVTRRSTEYSMRYIHRFELEHLLAACGWELVSVFGSYDLEPYAGDAERMIALATWGAGSRQGE